MEEKKLTGKAKKNREIILKALTDPKFRKALEEDPAKTLNMREFTDVNKQEIRLVLAAVRGINTLISAAADQILCMDGPCGIA